MLPTAVAPFRFRDLPSEIRNKIYHNLLCDIPLPPTTVKFEPSFVDFECAPPVIETAILRTSIEIYREAYDVMIKTNRFVKITSVQGLPMKVLINGLQVSVLCEDRMVVERFKGYVLAVHVGSKSPPPRPMDDFHASSIEACTIIILYRDLDQFCQALTDGDLHVPGFSKNLELSITMAPILDEIPRSRYKPSFDAFFSEKTQETLLEPFRKRLRGYKAVTIHGHVNDDLAKSVRDEMGKEKWTDPEEILIEYAMAKEEGLRLFKERKNEQACNLWQDAVTNIDKIHESSSWPNLVRRGGEGFVSQIAEIYFIMLLNIAHLQLIDMQVPQSTYFGSILAEDALSSAISAIRKGFWMDDYKYKPSAIHFAKLHYRYAFFLRLQAEQGWAEKALVWIDKALRLQPGDSAILREKQNIIDAMESV